MRWFRRKDNDVPTLEVGSSVRCHGVTWVVTRTQIESSGYGRIDLQSPAQARLNYRYEAQRDG